MAGNNNGAGSLPGYAAKRNNAFFPLPEPEKPPQNTPLPLAPDSEWEELVGALRRNRRRLLRMPGVTALDVGYKIKEGCFTNTLALRIHVERKQPDRYFKFRQEECFVKKNSKLMVLGKDGPICLKDVEWEVDVIEADYRLAAPPPLPQPGAMLEKPLDPADVDRRRRLDPLVGGLSIGGPFTSVGTLGALVWDRTDGSVCILSNWHVLAGHMRAGRGTPCFQPAPFDGGGPNDVVARLKRWSFDCQTDAALAELTGNRHYCAGEIVELYQQISDVTRPYLGMRVLKSGRSTGFSRGFIDGLYFSSAIEYSNGIVQVFEDQIHIAPLYEDRISEPGDSGSVWVTKANGRGYEAVGLHFGGDLLRSAFGEYAIANPMTMVAERLNFSFRPLFLELRDERVVTLPVTSKTDLDNELGNGNGGRPIGIFSGGLDGTGGQTGDPIQTPPGG